MLVHARPARRAGAATSKIGAAKNRALQELIDRTGVQLTWDDFEVTLRGPDHLTGHNVPVEWRAVKMRSDTEFTFVIDMDDIPPNAVANGPDRPHVGYSYWGRGGRHARPRFNGHIFVEQVPATRNDPVPYRR